MNLKSRNQQIDEDTRNEDTGNMVDELEQSFERNRVVSKNKVNIASNLTMTEELTNKNYNIDIGSSLNICNIDLPENQEELKNDVE
jgi:hypothetical protein